jgi:hypothetical protein
MWRSIPSPPSVPPHAPCTRSEQARKNRFPYFAKIQLSTTWNAELCRSFRPESARAQSKGNAERLVYTGTMGHLTIGSYPSPNTEAFALQNWHPQWSNSDVVRHLAIRRYGPEAAPHAANADQTQRRVHRGISLSPFSPTFSGPLQHGPALPWYRHDIPAPYGNASLLNSKDDWRNWPAPYGPSSWPDYCDTSALVGTRVGRLAAGNRRNPYSTNAPAAQRDFDVAWMVAYYYRAYANALDLL